MANSSADTPQVAETSPPDAIDYAQAILDEHAWRVPASYPGVVLFQGVPTFGPGDPVATSHPAFEGLKADGVLEPIVR